MKTKPNSLQIVFSGFNKIIATVFLFVFFVNISYSQRTIDQAKNFAIEKIKNFDFNTSQDKNQVPLYSIGSDPITFLDTAGTKSAYMFKILKDNEYFGYITVNALDEFYPLVGLAYDVEWLPNRIKELKNVMATHPQYSDRNWNFVKFIYTGGQDYLALYKNANQLLYVSLESKQIIPDNIISERIKLWEGKRQNLIESKNKNKSATLNSSKSISGVKAYTWYRGCSTTALSMILDFWGEHGFPNLNYASSSFSWNGPGETSGTCSSSIPLITRDLADELASAMGISYECQWNSEGNWGSTAEQQRDALLKITSNKGYNFSFEVDNTYSLTKFQNEIDANRPVKIGYNIDGQADKGHAVCGIGYNYDGSAHLLQYYNTWDTGTHWMTAENECIKNWVTCVPPKQLPDLTPVRPSISVASVQAGSTLTAYSAENNIGYGSADANVISIHLSTNDILTPKLNGDIYLDEIPIPGVSNNSCSLIYSKDILIPSNTPAGDYYLFFSADGGEAINEASEDNNRVSLRLNITSNSTFNPARSLTAVAGNGQVSLNWLAPSLGTPTSYTVYRSTSETGTFTALTPNITSLSYTATGLTNETTYWFKVKANYSSGSSDFSTAISAKPTSGTTFNPPTNLAVSAGNGQVTVNWSKPSSGTPDSYTVYRSTSEAGTYTALTPNTQLLSFTASGLTNGTTYWFKVKANYSGGSSVYSSSISAIPTAPSILTNDEPCNADLLTVQSTYSYVTKTIVGATKSTQVPDASCDQPSNVDVWFKFTIPSGTFGIHTNSISISGNDCGMAIYTGSCSSLTQRYCIQGGNPLQSYMPWEDDLNLTSYAGQTGYIRVWEYGTVSQTGSFQIGLAGVSPNGGNCTITSISPSSETHNSSSFSTTPGEDDIIVNGQPNCTYTVSESCSWLTVSPMSGTMNSNSTGTIGQAFLNYSIQANTSTSSRQCTFYINGSPVTITQNGEEADDDDFYVQNVNVPSTTLGINSSVNVSCNQCYSGSKSESVLGVSTIGYYLSTNASFDSNDILLATDISGLGSDDPCNLESALLTIPGNTAPGQYYILFVADHDKVYSESNENNNVVAVQISVNAASHDFYILNESVYPNKILSSGLPTIRCDLGYSGSALDAELSNCHVGYYLSTDKNFSSTSDTYFGSSITGIGSDNPIKDLSYAQASIPAGTPPGNYYILIVADYDGRFVETDEDNNAKYVQITVVGSSASEDFYIQNSSVSSSSVVAGGTIDVECTQSYIGSNLDVNMGSSVVGYYLSKNTTPGSINDIKLGTDGSSLGSDYPFESESATLTVPAGTLPGQYYLLFVADYDNRFNESDENNNVSYLQINVTGECIAPVIYLHPSAQAITDGESANFSITASGSNNQYQWQYNSGSSWSDVPNSSPYSGVNTNNLNVSSTAMGMNGYLYRCYVTSSCTTATATSNEAVLTVNAGCTAPVSPIEATASQTTIASGQSTILQVVGGTLNSAPDWVWYTGNCDGTIVGHGSSLSVSPTETTTYFVNSSACGIITTCKSVTVNVVAEYNISTSSSPTEGGTINGGGKYEGGKSCTVEAIANNGYDFSHWSESGITVSTNPAYSFNVTENRTLVANFITSSIPTITISTTSLPDFGTVIVGQHSIPASYTIWGSLLKDNITIIAPHGFQVSKSSNSGFSNELTLLPSGGQVSPTTIYVRFSPADYGYQLGNISHTCSNTTIKNVKVTGTGSQSCTPVTMVTQPQSIWIKPGNTATFNISVNGSGPFSYYWYKDGKFLTSTKDISSPSNSYTIPLFSSAENSYYYCIITNCDSTYVAQSDNAELTMIPDEERTFIDIEGNIYTAVTIGTQLWMGQNLKTTRYNDGTSIILNTDEWGSSDAPAYCWYNNDISNKNPYGALYNWNSVNTGKLCPSGWHVPTDDEWTTLTDYLGGESVAGGKLKESGTVHWKSANYGTNDSRFTALPGGERWMDGSFNNIGARGIWWSSTQDKSYNAYSRYIYFNENSIVRGTIGNKFFGYSVRCLCDLLSANKYELKDNNQLVLYPNPTKGLVNISLDKTLKGDFKVEIYNNLALLMQTKSITFSNGVAQIDLSTYSPGMYLIRIDIKDNKFFGKVLKE